MTLFLLSAATLIAVGLILVILIQNPKTGTLDTAFNVRQFVGTAQSQGIAEKATWSLMALMLMLCLVV